MRARKVVIKGNAFNVAYRLANAGIPFAFDKQAGCNTVGFVPTDYIPALTHFLYHNPDMEGRYAKIEKRGTK